MTADTDGSLRGSYRGFNILAWAGKYCAVAQALGPIDLTKEAERAHPDLVWADDMDELRRRIDAGRLWKRYDPLSSDTPLSELGVPEVVEIEPIHTCNLRCVMCHVSYETPSKEQIDPSFVNQLRGLEGRWAKLGSLYEPVAHPQFDQIAQGLTALEMDIDLTTNGTLFTPALIERVQNCNFQNVVISFDGIRPKTYERIRRGADYKRAVERILAFKEAVQSRTPRARFQINYVILRSNIDEIPEAVRFWESHGFDHIGFIGMVVRNDNATLRAESIEPALEEMYARLDEAARLIIGQRYRITASSPRFRDSDLERKFPRNIGAHGDGLAVSDHPQARTPIAPSSHFQNGDFPGMQTGCRSPFKLARISYDGKVYLCQQFPVGNIYKDSLLDIWRNQASEEMRRVVKSDVEVCYKCEYYRFCIKANEVNYTVGENFISRNKVELLENFWPYNLLNWMDKYFAVPCWQAVRSAELADASAHSRLGILSGTDLEQVRQQAAVTRPPFEQAPSTPQGAGQYTGYDLYYLGDQLIGVPKWLKIVDLRDPYQWAWEGFPRATSLLELRALIDQASKEIPEYGKSGLALEVVEISCPYNFVRLMDKYFAVPNWYVVGSAELADASAHSRLGILSGTDLTELRRRTADLLNVTAGDNFISRNKIEVIETLWGYNLLSWMDQYFAAPCWQAVSSAELADASAHSRLGILSGADLEEVRRRAAVTRPPFEQAPATPLAIGPYAGYNLYYTRERFIAVQQWWRTVDLLDPYQREWEGFPKAASLLELRALIDQASKEIPEYGKSGLALEVVEISCPYNFVRLMDKYFAVPNGCVVGSAELADPTRRAKLGILVSADLRELRRRTATFIDTERGILLKT